MPPRTDWSRNDYRLTGAQKIDAREALKLLSGSGITLEEAARMAVAGKRIITRTTVADAVDRFILSRLRKTNRRGKPLRAASIEWYQDFLAPLVRDHSAEYLDAIDRTQLAKWLHTRATGPTSRTAIARACRALWRWALAEDPPLVTSDATIGLSFSTGAAPESERLVLSVDQAAAILAGAEWSRSAVALMLFAGLRPEEVAGEGKARLLWQHVSLTEKFIRVPAEVSKTGKTRLIEHLPDTVWAWLTPPDRLSLPVSPYSARAIRERAARSAGLIDAAGEVVHAWPHDCFRHTAASYLLAFRRDAGVVAEWLGHEGRPTLLHQTYRGLLTLDRQPVNHAEALRYFALRPKM
jgi:site-specific recombinase XerD